MNGLPDAPIGFGLIVAYYQFARIQPYGSVAFFAQFGFQDGGGKDFAEGYFFRFRGLAQQAEQQVHPLLHQLPLETRKEAFHDIPVPPLHFPDAGFIGLEQGIRAAADGAAHQHHLAPGRLLFHNIQYAGHIGGRCHGRATEFQNAEAHSRSPNS